MAAVDSSANMAAAAGVPVISPSRADPDARLVEEAVPSATDSSSPGNAVASPPENVTGGAGDANAPGATAVTMTPPQEQVQGATTQGGQTARAVATPTRSPSREDVEKRGAGASLTIFLVIVWLVLMGIILIFCFSPANVDLAIACMLLGVLVGIIGMLSVSTNSVNGVRVYLILATILLLLTFILWGYYVYSLARAAATAADVSHRRLLNWIDDSTGSFPMNAYGGPSVTRLRTRDGALPEVELDADLLKPCQEGYERRGDDFLQDTGIVYAALASRGQLCNYSHYDILRFKKWPEDCWKTCGFEHLAINDSFELNDQSHLAALDKFKATVEALPEDKQIACAAYSMRTACVVEDTSYVYVLLGIISLFLLCTCCACLCCLPASLLVSGKYLSELRKYNKATRTFQDSPGSPGGQVEMTTP